MKRILSLAVILMMFVATSVEAQTLTRAQIQKSISSEIVKTYRAYTDADLEVSVNNLPFTSVELRDGRVSYKVTSNQDMFMARDIKRVQIFVNGQLAKSFAAPVQVKAYKNVLVAREYIDRDSAITALNTKVERREISNILDNVLTQNRLASEMFSKKVYRENEVIDKRFVKRQPDVTRNDEVVALFKSKDITISVSATSLSDGMIGDYVLLKSAKYNKSYRGKVIGRNRVVIAM